MMRYDTCVSKPTPTLYKHLLPWSSLLIVRWSERPLTSHHVTLTPWLWLHLSTTWSLAGCQVLKVRRHHLHPPCIGKRIYSWSDVVTLGPDVFRRLRYLWHIVPRGFFSVEFQRLWPYHTPNLLRSELWLFLHLHWTQHMSVHWACSALKCFATSMQLAIDICCSQVLFFQSTC